MTSKSKSVMLVLVGVIVLGSPVLAYHEMDADIGINRRPASDPNQRNLGLPDVQSAAVALVFDPLTGQIDYGAHITGTHWIHEAGGTVPIVASHNISALGEYNNGSVRGPTEYGECYRASINASSVHNTNKAMTTLEEVCADGDPASPVILDLDSNGFHLVGLDDGVEFDLDSDGMKETCGWTREDQRDAFLCLDRNGNGLIDDGSELFGNYTPLASGDVAENGYLALAEIDEPLAGGNGDGYINVADRQFSDLCVWIDSNHNGTSEASELSSLEEAGVIELEYRYVTQRRKDHHGNAFTYKSRGWMAVNGATERRLQTYDVFFVVSR